MFGTHPFGDFEARGRPLSTRPAGARIVGVIDTAQAICVHMCPSVA